MFEIPLTFGVTYFWRTTTSGFVNGTQLCWTTSPDGATFNQALPCGVGPRGFGNVGPFTFYDGQPVYIGVSEGRYCYSPT